MLNKLNELILQPLSVRTLWEIQKTAMSLVDSTNEPLVFFVIASIAGRIANRFDGEPMDADFSEIRDSVLQPIMKEAISAYEQHDNEQLVGTLNKLIKTHILSVCIYLSIDTHISNSACS
jgi:hypothetical protein